MAFEGKSRILMVVKETEKRDAPGQGWGLWLIGYYDKDDNPFSVKVVCGTFSTDPGTGEKRYYAKGMGLRDFDALRPRWKEAEVIMRNPPRFEAPVADDIQHEESPFG